MKKEVFIFNLGEKRKNALKNDTQTRHETNRTQTSSAEEKLKICEMVRGYKRISLIRNFDHVNSVYCLARGKHFFFNSLKFSGIFSSWSASVCVLLNKLSCYRVLIFRCNNAYACSCEHVYMRMYVYWHNIHVCICLLSFYGISTSVRYLMPIKDL